MLFKNKVILAWLGPGHGFLFSCGLSVNFLLCFGVIVVFIDLPGFFPGVGFLCLFSGVLFLIPCSSLCFFTSSSTLSLLLSSLLSSILFSFLVSSTFSCSLFGLSNKLFYFSSNCSYNC